MRFVLMAALLLALSAGAQARITLTPLTSTSTFSFTGGDIVWPITYCVESIAEAGAPGTTIIQYDVNANIGGTSQPFQLTPAPNIPVQLQWTDTRLGNTVDLQPNLTTGRSFSGSLCNGGDSYGRLTITASASAIAAVPGGTYTQTFNITVTNAGAGRKTQTGTVTITINVPKLARISQLNDISLGTWTGSGNMTGFDTLCVYRNGTGLYSITATGDGVGSAFSVRNGAAPPIPYSVSWNDGTGAVPMTSGTPLANRSNAFTANTTCNSGVNNNATVAVTVNSAALAAATATGLYSGLLTLTLTTQ